MKPPSYQSRDRKGTETAFLEISPESSIIFMK